MYRGPISQHGTPSSPLPKRARGYRHHVRYAAGGPSIGGSISSDLNRRYWTGSTSPAAGAPGSGAVTATITCTPVDGCQLGGHLIWRLIHPFSRTHLRNSTNCFGRMEVRLTISDL